MLRRFARSLFVSFHQLSWLMAVELKAWEFRTTQSFRIKVRNENHEFQEFQVARKNEINFPFGWVFAKLCLLLDIWYLWIIFSLTCYSCSTRVCSWVSWMMYAFRLRVMLFSSVINDKHDMFVQTKWKSRNLECLESVYANFWSFSLPQLLILCGDLIWATKIRSLSVFSLANDRHEISKHIKFSETRKLS